MQIFKRAIYFYYDNICLTIIFLENNKSKATNKNVHSNLVYDIKIREILMKYFGNTCKIRVTAIKRVKSEKFVTIKHGDYAGRKNREG